MFNIKLKEIREARGLSQKQLANILEVSQGSVGNWESGTREPNFEMLKKLAGFFEVTTDYLLGKEESASKNAGIDSMLYSEFSELTNPEKEDVLAFINFTKAKRQTKK